jgi:hypothetical protein
VLVDPEVGLPGIYLARVVATLENDELSECRRGALQVVNFIKSPLVGFSPHEKDVKSIGGNLKSGSGECLPELPEGGLLVATTSQGKDLQALTSSRPAENGVGNQVDTHASLMIQDKKVQSVTKMKNDPGCLGKNQTKLGDDKNEICKGKMGTRKAQVLGFVPIQIVNLSQGEVKLERQTYVGVASPTRVDKTLATTECGVSVVRRDTDLSPVEFDDYVREKLTHLKSDDRHILEPIIRRYQHLFYGLGSKELGITSQVEHSIDTRDARLIKRTPYRTPHALKAVVKEHIENMMEKKIIQPSMSPWSSSIVLVRKKSKDNSVR